jgi:hypothetical protein
MNVVVDERNRRNGQSVQTLIILESFFGRNEGSNAKICIRIELDAIVGDVNGL